MAELHEFRPSEVSGFDTSNIEWVHLEGGDEFDYPIDYWLAILGTRPDTGRVDFLGKWEPNAYCHYHRHLCETTALVLEGEHHLVETNATETIHKTRKPGHYAHNPAGDLHMEYAGPNGSVVFFSMHTPDGRLFEVLDQNEKVLTVATIEDFAAGRLTGAK